MRKAKRPAEIGQARGRLLPMRLLHLTDRLTDRGGAHWHLIGVLESLVAAGHTVALVAGEDDGRVAAPCPVTRLPELAARVRAPADLDALAARFAPDVIHVHTVVNPDVLEWAASRGAVMTVQDHRYFCPAQGKWTARGEICREPMTPTLCAACFDDERYADAIYALTAERLAAVQRMARVIVLSQYMKRELRAARVDEHVLRVVPPFVHGLDPDAVAEGPPCVLFVGRLTAGKGVLEAVDAWRQSGVALPLVCAGTGSLRTTVEAAGATVLGWVDHARLSSVLRSARALIMPSRWQEPFGIAGLEALAMGVPVVAWSSGGVPEWHPGPGLVAWGDVAGLARALAHAVAAPRPTRAASTRDERTAVLLEIYEHVLCSPAKPQFGLR
jgi:glycosyltransferase involved in cell wall biosynthesis